MIKVNILDKDEFDREFSRLYGKNSSDESIVFIRRITYLPGNKLNPHKDYDCKESYKYRALVYSKKLSKYIVIDSGCDEDLYRFILNIKWRTYER